MSTVPQDITDAFPRRLVLSASLPDSNNISSVMLSMAGNMDVTGKQTVPQGGYVGPGGTCISGIGVGGRAFSILLSGPDPLKNPLLGDGGNQYVYDAEQPDGYLAVPASVSVPGASSADTSWLLSHVGLFVSPAMQTGAQSFQWQSYGSQMYVYTPGTYPDHTSYPSAAFIYQGLPPDNSYFGNHVMTMKVDGNVSQTANYQLFFNGTAINHPNPDSYNSPDWYYYYSGVYTPFSAFTAPVNYRPTSQAYPVSETYGTYPYTAYLADDAYNASGYEALRVFTKSTGTPGYVQWAGYLVFPNGILQFIHTAAHERGHQYIDQLSGMNGRDGPIYTDHRNSDVDQADTNHSFDGDIVSDSWEATHGLNLNTRDTTGAYNYNRNGTANTTESGDNELVADIQALPTVFNQLNDWQQDWADGGIQHGVLPFLQPDPATGIAPGFSLRFYPVMVNADHTWTEGAGQSVKSLNDIQNIVGTSNHLVTQLTDLGP